MELKAQTRKTGKRALEALRREGLMPLVAYGPSEESKPLAVSLGEFKSVWKNAGETTVVTIKTENGDIDALIHDVAVHPVTGEPLHVDFYAIEKGKPVEVTVPLEFEGEAPAVKDGGGTLVKVLYELDVEALPQDIPHEITVDIAPLKELDDTILVGDLKLPSNVTLKTDEEETVAAISVQEEEPDEPAEEVDFETAVEVEEKGKKEDDKEATEESS